VVPPDSQRIPRARCYLGSLPGGNGFSRTGVSPSTPRLSRRLPLTTLLSDSRSARQRRLVGPTTPHLQRLPAVTQVRFGLIRFRSPLLTESRLFSFPAGTEMFHFPAFPPLTLCVQVRVTAHDCCRVSPFGHPRISARLAAPRGFSQPPTSFFGSWCQGIHRMPLITWPQRCSRPLCSSQGTDGAVAGLIAYRLLAGRSMRRRPEVTFASLPTPVPSGLNSVPTAVPRRWEPSTPDLWAGRPQNPGSTGSQHHGAAELVSVPPVSNHVSSVG
jgi:hypothetical protein